MNDEILIYTFSTFQAYFIGCSFDSFSTSWKDRSYVITLMVMAWVIPLTILFLSHFSIVHSVRKSNVQVLCETKFSCGLTKKCVKINIDDSVPDSNAVAVDTRPSHRRSQRVSTNLYISCFYPYNHQLPFVKTCSMMRFAYNFSFRWKRNSPKWYHFFKSSGYWLGHRMR